MNSSLRLDPTAAWAPAEFNARRPWTRQDAAHLYRRAAFGASPAELERAETAGLAATLDEMFSPPPDDHPQEIAAAALGRTILAGGNCERLPQWWLHRMLHSPRPAIEKVVLFWHGHFALSARKVDDPQMMMDHVRLLREHALGRFEPFVQAMSRDPAMLVWLDSATNRKGHPNENYARELMELFCLGPGNYTERDIREIARAFTGWEVQRGRFKFTAHRHDAGPKSILGKTGDFNGDDAVRIVLEQPAAARFLVRKLFRFYVADEPDPSAELLEPLAVQLRKSDYRIAPVLRTMFTSHLFHSAEVRGRKVRSPVELGIGLLRCLGATANLIPLAEQLERLGQAVLYPPSVKGWDGGRAWITTAALLGRVRLVQSVLKDENSRFDGRGLDEFFPDAGPDDLLARAEMLFLPVPLPPAARAALREVAAQPGRSRKEVVRETLCLLAAQPEFQLN